ncbi:hypothetical protein [Salinarimonas soli]|nr:hypothetical protein [Salinarimonas soli]
MTQRGLYIAGGLGLAAAAAQPRPNPLLNLLALAGGAYLVLSGYQGHCPVKAALVDGGADGSMIGRQGGSRMTHEDRGRQPIPSTRTNTASHGAHTS